MNALSENPTRLSAGCSVAVEGRCVTLGTREEEFLIESDDAGAVGQFMRQLRLGERPARLAEQFRLSAPSLAPLFDLLRERDLLLDVDGAAGADTTEDTVAALRAEARFWARPIFEQPFWDAMLAGKASRGQVLGWGVEFYHFVEAANSYMPLGVAHVRQTRSMREAIARHYVQEMHHGEIFLDGLSRCGIDTRSIKAAPPLPQTAALINNLVEFAYEGELAYTASFAVMQPGLSHASAEELDRFYGALTDFYPYAKEMFGAFHRHASLDLTLHHEDPLFFTLCRQGAGLPVEARRRASHVMQSVAESFILFFEGIGDAYRDSSTFAPRRPVRLEAFR